MASKDHSGKNNLRKPATRALPGGGASRAHRPWGGSPQQLSWRPRFHLCFRGAGRLASSRKGLSAQHTPRRSPVTSTVWHGGGGRVGRVGPARGEQLVRGNELKGDKKRVCIVNF